MGCSSSGTGDNAARDQCEQTAGVGRCVQRHGVWRAIGSRNGTSVPATTRATTTTTTSPPTTAVTTSATTTTAAPVGPRDVRTEPAGLFCRDLSARGYSYSAAVDYWRAHGDPNQMDADRNGIPCETVYLRSDVISYWGLQPPTPVAAGLAHGLYCRDLYAMGIGYPEAVAYWYAEGAPARMDAVGNGVPCQTVYSASVVGLFWRGY